MQQIGQSVQLVSIHAPIRVRPVPQAEGHIQVVSIHAPIRVRPLTWSWIFRQCCFNPRTHTGATHHHPAMVSLVDVSIHAPIRVRPLHCVRCRSRPKFQSTHPYGCDWTSARMQLLSPVSIHAPIRVRQLAQIIKAAFDGFNPRTHTGATTPQYSALCPAGFQSTHPYGCDFVDSLPFVVFDVSIHAPIRVRPVHLA